MQRMRNMSRVVWTVTGIGVVSLIATFMSTGSTVASGAASRPSRPYSHLKASGIVTSGSTWTYYDEDPFIGVGFCEVLTFASRSFSGDQGDAGKWSGNVKITFNPSSESESLWYYLANDWNNGALGSGPLLYTGKYASAFGFFVGDTTQAGFASDYGELIPGDDPLGEGDC
jgi:hypothetical protein